MCMSAPPFIVGAIYVFGIALVSDRWKARGLTVTLNCILAVIGCALVGYHRNDDVRYFGCFLGVAGASGESCLSLNLRPSSLMMTRTRFW